MTQFASALLTALALTGRTYCILIVAMLIASIGLDINSDIAIIGDHAPSAR